MGDGRALEREVKEAGKEQAREEDTGREQGREDGIMEEEVVVVVHHYSGSTRTVEIVNHMMIRGEQALTYSTSGGKQQVTELLSGNRFAQLAGDYEQEDDDEDYPPMTHEKSTPGIKDGENDKEEALDEKRAGEVRRWIAIMNYVAQDRPDLGYAVKECARMMSRPTTKTERAIKRLARYLRQCPRRVYEYRWQREPEGFITYTDSDWAGCSRTRRSTSGGVVLRGSHMIRHWSRTQASVALSTGEAELYAVVKASTETLGLIGMAAEMGLKQSGRICTDSSAAKGAVSRSGNGRMKHIDTNRLWVQEKAVNGELVFEKIQRSDNFADLLTHHWTGAPGEAMFQKIGLGRTWNTETLAMGTSPSRGGVAYCHES